ncbi:acyl-CoA N-acyltransferase [Atractiella rhizophila]|nr:acyl-CoA N-acyltransferase [Atractiella rhizophila]
MSLLRPFVATDLFKFNNVNLDSWTETFSTFYYMNYLCSWPDLFSVQESPDGTLMGYVMGKTEGVQTDWHAHVSAITVAPSYRRLGLASKMMGLLERVGNNQQAWFVDLFVRPSNETAVDMYESIGYSVYRKVRGYYGGGVKEGEEDAYDMRKALLKDVHRISVRENGRSYSVDPNEIYW